MDDQQYHEAGSTNCMHKTKELEVTFPDAFRGSDTHEDDNRQKHEASDSWDCGEDEREVSRLRTELLSH